MLHTQAFCRKRLLLVVKVSLAAFVERYFAVGFFEGRALDAAHRLLALVAADEHFVALAVGLAEQDVEQGVVVRVGRRGLPQRKERYRPSDGVSFDAIYTDNWKSFNRAFLEDSHVTGKKNTVGIEGNSC